MKGDRQNENGAFHNRLHRNVIDECGCDDQGKSRTGCIAGHARRRTHLSNGPDKPPAMSEDCLYLNVWTPAKSAHDWIRSAGLDLRWRIQCGHYIDTDKQWRRLGAQRRSAGQHRLPSRPHWFPGAPGADRCVAAPISVPRMAARYRTFSGI
jgi:hypothetical protein